MGRYDNVYERFADLAEADVRNLLRTGVPPEMIEGGTLDVDGLRALGWTVDLTIVSPPSTE